MSAQILLLNPRHKKRPRRINRRRSRKGREPAGLRAYRLAHRKNRRPRKVAKRRRARVMRVGRSYRVRARARRTYRRARRVTRHVYHRARHYGRRAFASVTGRGIVGQYIVPAGLGGLGALGLDIAWGYAAPHLPAQLQTGWASLAAKSALVIGGVYLAGRYGPAGLRTKIHMAGVGAITVLAAAAIKGAAQGILPATTPGMSGYIDYQSYALPGARAGMHGYMPRTLGSLEDLYSPAAVIQPAGTPVPRQFGGFGGYVAVQPHVMGNGGLMGYEWAGDGM